MVCNSHLFPSPFRVWITAVAVLSQGSVTIREIEMARNRNRSRQFQPILAQKWERIARIRSRFRRGADWLKFAKGVKGDDIVQCTPSLSCNFEVLATALETCGLRLQSVKALEKEVRGGHLCCFHSSKKHSQKYGHVQILSGSTIYMLIIYIYISIHVYTCICIYFLYIHAYVYIYICIYMHMYIYIHIYIYICIYVCVFKLAPKTNSTFKMGFPCQVQHLFGLSKHVPEEDKQAYVDGWNVRRMLKFAVRRQADAARRGQKARESCLLVQYPIWFPFIFTKQMCPYMYIYLYTCIYIYIFIFTYSRIYIYIYTYIYIYIHAHFSPPRRWGLLDFITAVLLLLLLFLLLANPLRQLPRQSSSPSFSPILFASFWSQWALLDLNCQLPISVGTLDLNDQILSPNIITKYHHKTSSLSIITVHHHKTSSQTIFTNHYHRPSSQNIITIHHHKASPQIIITDHFHETSSQYIITKHHHKTSSQIIFTKHHRNTSSQSIITIHHHKTSSQSIFTKHHHNTSSQNIITDHLHKSLSQTIFT